MASEEKDALVPSDDDLLPEENASPAEEADAEDAVATVGAMIKEFTVVQDKLKLHMDNTLEDLKAKNLHLENVLSKLKR